MFYFIFLGSGIFLFGASLTHNVDITQALAAPASLRTSDVFRRNTSVA